MPSIDTANDPARLRSMGRWSRSLAGPFLDFAAIDPATRIVDVGSDGDLAIEEDDSASAQSYT